MKKTSLILLIALLTAVCAYAADGIKWLSTDYDFGSFREVEGKKTGRVQFVNIGSEPTIITRVKPTCGCTVAEFTQGEIAPGDTATVSFTYNPAGRPGMFIKHLRVYTGTNEDISEITIKGKVIGAPETLAADYPVVAGALRLSTDTLNMGHLTEGKSRNEFIHGYNQSSDTLALSYTDVPKALSIGVSSNKITPGDIFTLSVYLNSSTELEPGPNELKFNICSTAGGETSVIPFTVKCFIDKDFSKLSPEEMKNAPVVNIFPTTLELGTVSADDKNLKTEVTILNEGITPLTIRRIYSPQLALKKTTKIPLVIKAGQKKKLEVVLDASNIPAGLFNIPIEILTDDPIRPNTRFRVVGTRK